MFVDSNVLANSLMMEAPDHEIAKIRLERALQSGEPLRISRQVVRGYLSTVTRPKTWTAPVPIEDALDDASRLMHSFEVLEDGPAVTESLLALCREVAV